MKTHKGTKIYLDLDGVLADLDARLLSLSGKKFSDFPSTSAAWKVFGQYKNLFADVPKMSDADQLVAGVQQLAKQHHCTVEILTAIPLLTTMPSAENDKHEWVKKHFGNIPFNIGPHAKDKWKHCRAGDILIDDKLLNIQQWNDVGGFGILHTDARHSLNQLRDHFNKQY
jgi:5'(3')-deoxyribonucleotidase